MNDFLVLKILDIFRPLFIKFNIDYPLLRSMLAVKLLMDARRVPTLFRDTQEKKGNLVFKSLWIYALYGLILVYFIFGEAYMVQMSIIFGIALFILMTSLIADFSPIILDTRDKAMTQTKPIDQRTIGLAKFIHVLMYLALLTGAFAIIPMLFMLFVQGILFTILFMFMLILFMLFTIAVTSLVYIFVLKFFHGGQLKTAINYIQILFAIGIIIGYQIIIRTYGYIDVQAAYVFEWWHAILPPFLFAAPFELVMNQNFSSPIIVLSLFSLIFSFLFVFLYCRLIPAFEKHLPKLLASAGRSAKREPFSESIWKRLLCSTEESRTYFQFIYRMIQRERQFKLKVYPSLGIGVVLPFIFLFTIIDTNAVEDIAAGNLYFYIYLMNIFIGIALYTFQFSDNYKAAWIFTSADRNISVPLYEAVMKVFLVKLYLPMFLFAGAGYYLLFSGFHLIDLAIVFVSAMIQALLSYKLVMKSDYPFSLSYSQLSEEGNIADALLLIFLAVPFAVFHIVISLEPYVSYAYFAVLLAGAIILWKSFFKRSKNSW
jgi:hypothetical protein